MLSITRRTNRDKRNQNIKFLEKWVHRNRNRPKSSSNHLTKDVCWRKKSQDELSSKHDSPQANSNGKKKKFIPNLILKFSESEGSSDENESFFNMERRNHQRRCFRKRRFSKGDKVDSCRSFNYFPETSPQQKTAHLQQKILPSTRTEQVQSSEEIISVQGNLSLKQPFFQTPAAPSIQPLFSSQVPETSNALVFAPNSNLGFFSPFFNSSGALSSRDIEVSKAILPATSTSSNAFVVANPNPLVSSTNILGMLRGDVTCCFNDQACSPISNSSGISNSSRPRNPFESNALSMMMEIDNDGDVIMEDACTSPVSPIEGEIKRSEKKNQRTYPAESLFASHRGDLAFPIYNVFECNIITLDFCMTMIQMFKEKKVLHESIVDHILSSASNLFEKLPNCIEVSLPPKTDGSSDKHITVVGDTHGQFLDMLEIFSKNGYPSESNFYLFNGDYVDRGDFGCEIVLTLCLFKLLYPNCVHLLRGNHECREINTRHGFETEVLSKYSASVFESFQNCFSALPISAVINHKIFVCHGGLSEKADLTIRDINQIERKGPVPYSGVFADLLWSDPRPNLVGTIPSDRGASICFGLDRVKLFLKNNNLDLMIRSHEFKFMGYETMGDGPELITVFSAPNYVGKWKNLGAYIRFRNDESNPEYCQFFAAGSKKPGDSGNYNSIMSQFRTEEEDYAMDEDYNCSSVASFGGIGSFSKDEIMNDENDYVYG